MKKWILLIILLALPAAAWAVVKPIRILAPELVGVFCTAEAICVDDPSLHRQALQLYEASLESVSAKLGPLEQSPRAIFCSTAKCFESFGLKRAAATSIGTLGIVIGPRGWEPHYVKHELIHQFQSERLGSFRAWLMTPEWFIEGMAYSLSGDPRPTLTEPWESYRAQFDEWYANIDEKWLWIEAANL